ncbi:MAG: hypothetical protein WDN06_08005 [Asticcacaulis sp.]
MKSDVSEMALYDRRIPGLRARLKWPRTPKNVSLRALMETVTDNIRRGGHDLEAGLPDDDVEPSPSARWRCSARSAT